MAGGKPAPHAQAGLTLCFAVTPTMARRLRQHTLLADFVPAQARPRAIEIIWHDTPDGALDRRALALSSSRRVWRLHRSRPGPDPWPPATPAPLLAEGPGPQLAGHTLPPGLEPRARFVGREVLLTRARGEHAVIARIVAGLIRAKGTTRPWAELTLSGPEASVVDLAMALAETLPLLPPRASLPAEVVALVAGVSPPPRRVGTVTLRGNLTVEQAFTRVIAHLADVMLHWSRAIGPAGADPEPVHQMRVALRRMRSAISIFRHACGCPAVLAAGAGMREFGRILGPARDWDVFLDGLGRRLQAALPDEPALVRLLGAAQARRTQAYRDLAAYMAGPAFRRLCIALAAIATGTGWQAGLEAAQRAALSKPLSGFAADVLARRYRRVRRRGRDFTTLDVPALHAVRLAGKRLRYAAEFFAQLFVGRSAAQFIRRLARLQDRLGHLNDGAVAAKLLAELGPARGARTHAIGLVRGFVAADAGHGWDQLARDWKRFRKLAPFWT